MGLTFADWLARELPITSRYTKMALAVGVMRVISPKKQKISGEAGYERVAEASLELARKEADGQATAEEIALLKLFYVLLEEYERRADKCNANQGLKHARNEAH